MKPKTHDDYIANSAEFAQLILTHLRKIVHEAHPEIEETMKWSFPHFEYKGIVCSMAAFKQHCSFGFAKASLIKDSHKLLNAVGKTAMGHLGRITSVNDLPDKKILISYIQQAIELNEKGTKTPKASLKKVVVLEIPKELKDALSKHPKAKAVFEKFSPSHRKEYIEWIAEAKRPETREKRIATTIEWLTEGKSRNWKYQ